MKLINSGIVVLRTNGERSAVHNEEDVVEMAAPFHVNVALLRDEYEAVVRGDINPEDEKASTLSDRMVLRRFHTGTPGGGAGMA